jgi:hypothetical protein
VWLTSQVWTTVIVVVCLSIALTFFCYFKGAYVAMSLPVLPSSHVVCAAVER